jgi:AcrR family transcriptional regulator
MADPIDQIRIPRERGLSEATRDALFRAALEVFAERGMTRARVEEVAERAGVARATIYYHFRGKQELLLFLLHHGLALMASHVERAAAKAKTTERALEAIIDAHVDFFHAYQPFTQVVLSEIWHVDREANLSPQELLAGDVAVVGKVLSRAKAEGLVKAELDDETLIVALFGLVSSAAVYFSTYRRRFPREEVRVALKTIFLDGVRRQP